MSRPPADEQCHPRRETDRVDRRAVSLGAMASTLEVLESRQGEIRRRDVDALAAAARLCGVLAQTAAPGELSGVGPAAARLQEAIALGGAVDDPLDELLGSVRVAASVAEVGVVLCVEDESLMREVLVDALASPRRRVRTASTLAEARARLAEERVDLVVLDLHLPDGDGRSLLADLRRDPPTADLPVVVVSGNLASAAATESLALGADACVQKPFDPGVLKATAARLLTRHAQSQREARVDALTGLPNRAALAEIYTRSLAAAGRAGGLPLSVAILDLDGFKPINDLHGHLTGDRVLRWFAERMSSLLRVSDVIARWGGDEFVVFLPATTREGALALLERCVAGLADEPFITAKGEVLRVDFSAGVAEARPGRSLDEALESADRRLYRTKTSRYRRPPRG